MKDVLTCFIHSFTVKIFQSKTHPLDLSNPIPLNFKKKRPSRRDGSRHFSGSGGPNYNELPAPGSGKFGGIDPGRLWLDVEISTTRDFHRECFFGTHVLRFLFG